MSIIVETPFQNFTGLDGKPLTNGKVYIGQVGTDPTVFANQIPVFWDEALTIPASQPLTTNAGYIVRFGTPARVWVATDYSISVKNASNILVYYLQQVGVVLLSIYAKLSDLASSSGSALIGFLQSGAGAVIQTLQQKNRQQVHVFDFLTDSQRQMAIDGIVFDAAPAIQAAIDSVCPVNGSGGGSAGVVICDPRYPLTVRTSLNLTNSRVGGTRSRDFLRFIGFNLMGETGANTAVIETTGSQWLELDGTISSGAATKSTVGVLQAISAILPQTQNQKFRLRIFMHDDITANGGTGTVGLWVFGAEENTYDTCYIQANLPAFFTAYKVSPNYSSTIPASFQAPLLDNHSCGVNTFIGEQFLTSLGRHRPSLVTEDVNSFSMPTMYMSNLGTGGGNLNAWWQFGGFSGSEIGGTIEQHTGLYITGAVTGCKIRLTFGGLFDESQPRLVLARFSQGQFIDCELDFQDTVAPNRQLISAPPVSLNEQISCFLRNVNIQCNSDKQYLGLPENLVWNPHTGNVVVEGLQGSGLPYRYMIDGNRKAKVDILAKVVKISGGISSAEVVRFIMPTVAGSANALSAEIVINGTASIVGSTTNSMSVRTFHATISIIIGNTGTVATGAATIISSVGLDNNPGGNSITAIALTAGVNTGYVSLSIAPTLTGANQETVQFIGTAEMTWTGNESRAPSLAIP